MSMASDFGSRKRGLLDDPLQMHKLLQKLGMPRRVRDAIVVGAKRLAAPGEEQRRRALTADLAAPTSTDIAGFRTAGAAVLDGNKLPHRDAAVADAQAQFQRLRDDGKVAKPQGHYKGEFLIKVADGHQLLRHAGLFDFIVSDEMIRLASHYFGQVPVLSTYNMWWSPPNDSAAESQLYHYDGEDKSQLKVIVNVNDVSLDNGPFTFISAVDSTRIGRTRRHSARLDDEAVEGIAGPDAVTRLTGPAGTVGAVDTSRCLHYGSRGNSRERVILMAQFTRFLAPKAEMPDWHPAVDRQLTDLQRLVLNLRH